MSHPHTSKTPRLVPSQDHTTVVLRDGSTAQIRPSRAGDGPGLFEFFQGLSEESRALRFFGTLSAEGLRREAAHLAQADDPGTLGLVATQGRGERIIGHAMYCATLADRAEVAFAVAEECQGQELATLLLGQLARIASSRGIRVFEASFLPQNHSMLDVFRESGFPVRVEPAPGEIRVELPTGLSDEAIQQYEERERAAAVNAVHAFFHPRSIAVIGASRQRGTIGGEVFHNLLAYGFRGPVLPINPSAPLVQSVVAYPNVEEVPGPVDLAVIAVPADQVLDVAEGCGRKSVGSLVVISAGFGETGEEGRARQVELRRICDARGMRLIGPNCMGILNTDPAVRLNATFAPTPPPAGRVGFMSQSGALGLAIMDHASALGLGLSTFASVGNKADISGNDLLQYWEQDPSTDIILLYLESFGNPRQFSRIARRVARQKPIVVVKSGRSAAGVRAAGSHTGALLAASDVTVDALFRQAGVIRTDTLEEMFDVTSLLASQPPPRGRRVAIVTNAGGPGILCADTCIAEGLEVPVLAGETQDRLRRLLAPGAGVDNPVDMIASATAAQYREAIGIVGADPDVDALVVIFIPPLVTLPEDVAHAIVEGTRALEERKPVLTVFMQARGVPEQLRGSDLRLPAYSFPEDAAIALSRVAQYGEWLSRPPAPAARFSDLRREEAASVVAAALSREPGWLTPDEVWTLLSCYGLPMLPQQAVATAEQAAAAAAEMGGELALKAIARGLLHKTEAGAVRLALSPERILDEAREMGERLGREGTPLDGFLVQRMAPRGVEMIVGVVHDPKFGPVLACGAGGVLVELLKDVAVRLTPLSERDAREMVEGLRTYRLLTGYRGGPPHDVAALVEILLRVVAMVEDFPQIAELDLNPAIVHERGATVVDARVRVARMEPPLLPGARR